MSNSRRKIGLALGGGAVLGAAHIGVLRAIEESDFEVGWIAGTSIGALVGSLFAFGKDYENVKDIALHLSWSDITKFSPNSYGLFSNRKMEKLLKKHIGNAMIEDANIPLAIMATDISNGTKEVLTTGKVSDAVMASTCIPGIFQPVELNGKLLVDGGVIENVPVSPLPEMGADFIIAVDLNAKHKFRRPENIMDVLLNSFHFTLAAGVNEQSKKANILITPDLGDFNYYNIEQCEELILRGYNDTVEALNQITNK